MKYFFNGNYFDSVDTEEKAYWLGFIAADGGITHTSKIRQLAINLAGRDQNHLEKFQVALGRKGPLYFSTSNFGSPVVRLNITSKALVESLARQGIGPAKSFSVTPWEGSEELMTPYWRGVFDGDGSIHSFTRKSKKYWSVRLNGNREMVDGFVKFTKNRAGVTLNIEKHSRIWRASCGGINPPMLLLEFLYGKADVYLDRKFVLYEEIKRTFNER